MPIKNIEDSLRAAFDAELLQLAGDSMYAPRFILLGEHNYQLLNLFRCSRSTGLSTVP